ncbi:hypothetical protein N9S30_00455 [bacterium]|nr:hypothetical protein [bacterium]
METTIVIRKTNRCLLLPRSRRRGKRGANEIGSRWRCGWRGLGLRRRKYFPTCFKQSKEGNQVTVDPAQQKQWDGRLKELADTVRFFSDPSNPVTEPDHGRPCYVKEIAYRDVAGNAAKKRSRSEY